MSTTSDRPHADIRSAAALYHTDILIGRHSLVADEPLEMGGYDDGPTPTDLLVASLGACTSITLRMYAQRKQWPLEAVDVHVVFERDEAQQPVFRRTITLRGDLTPEQRGRLLQIAEQCPVHKLLTAPSTIHTAFSSTPS